MCGKVMGFTVCVLLVLIGSPAAAQIPAEVLRLGSDDSWNTVAQFENARLVPGWRGGMEVVLAEAQTALRDETDLLVTFDGVLQDQAGNYAVLQGEDLLVTVPAMNGGAAGFDGRNHIALRPGRESLFAPASQVQSFTIDLWFHPNRITEGAELLRWRGSMLEDGRPVLQELRLQIRDRRLHWVLDNLVARTGANGRPRMDGATLSARRTLIPRTWQHHQLRFDAFTGQLSYLVDQRTEAVTYLTSTGREDGTVHTLLFGVDTGEGLVVGRGVEGALDELRIMRTIPETARWTRFAGDPGSILTEPIDLGGSGAVVQEIITTEETPGRTGIRGFYRVADVVLSRDPADALDVSWTEIPQSGVIPYDPRAGRGRYLQLRFDLLADAARNDTPRLMDVEVGYLPALPPIPPRGVVGRPVPGGVLLEWNEAVGGDVAGYRVYLGEQPRRYTGTAAVASPIDAGSGTRLEITGLRPDVPYVFAIESYDRHGQISPLSPEVEVRAGRNVTQ